MNLMEKEAMPDATALLEALPQVSLVIQPCTGAVALLPCSLHLGADQNAFNHLQGPLDSDGVNSNCGAMCFVWTGPSVRPNFILIDCVTQLRSRYLDEIIFSFFIANSWLRWPTCQCSSNWRSQNRWVRWYQLMVQSTQGAGFYSTP